MTELNMKKFLTQGLSKRIKIHSLIQGQSNETPNYKECLIGEPHIQDSAGYESLLLILTTNLQFLINFGQ